MCKAWNITPLIQSLCLCISLATAAAWAFAIDSLQSLQQQTGKRKRKGAGHGRTDTSNICWPHIPYSHIVDRSQSGTESPPLIKFMFRKLECSVFAHKRAKEGMQCRDVQERSYILARDTENCYLRHRWSCFDISSLVLF